MSAPQLTLHAVPPSHPCMTAEAALRLKGLEFERVDLPPGPHIEEMAAIYGEGQTTVPGMLVDDEPVHGSRAILERLEEIAPDPPLYPEADRRRGARGRALGRRGAPGPRPPAAVGRSALPPRGDGHASAAPARSTRPAPTSRSSSFAPRGNTTGSPPRAWPRTSPACRRSSTTSTTLAARGVIGGEQPNAADLQIGATLRVLLDGRRRRGRDGDRPGAELARRWFPEYPGGIPAGAFPAGWLS